MGGIFFALEIREAKYPQLYPLDTQSKFLECPLNLN